MEIGNNPQRPAQGLNQDRANRPEVAQPAARPSVPEVSKARTGARPEPVTANPPASAQVALSKSAVQLMKAGDDADSFDAAKVQRMSQDIEEGRFKVNAERVADRLLASTNELISRKSNSQS